MYIAKYLTHFNLDLIPFSSLTAKQLEMSENTALVRQKVLCYDHDTVTENIYFPNLEGPKSKFLSLEHNISLPREKFLPCSVFDV